MVQNIGMLESAVMLTVDRNVCIHGIILASQVYGRNEDGTCDLTSTGDYTELLHCDLQDIDGNRLADTHFSGQSPRRSTIAVLFNQPTNVQRNHKYRIKVVFNRCGYYPLLASETTFVSEGVQFQFGDSPGTGSNRAVPYVSDDPVSMDDGSQSPNIKDGFIHGVIFLM